MPYDYGLLDLNILSEKTRTEMAKMYPAPTNYMSGLFFPERGIDSNKAFWDILYRNNGSMGYIDKGGLPLSSPRSKVGEGYLEVAYKKETFFMDANETRWQRKPGTQNQQTIEDAIIEQQQIMFNRLYNTNEIEAWSCLRGTYTYATNKGQSVTVDYGMPTEYKLTVTDEGQKWSNIAANIVAQVKTYKRLLKNVQQESIKLYCRSVVMDYICQNTEYLADLGDNIVRQQIALEGKINRIAGVPIETIDTTYTTDAGVETYFLAANEIFMVGNNIGKRLVAPAAEAKNTPTKFIHVWEENKERFGTGMLVGQYSLPALYNPLGCVHVVVCD
jgi:hypothetical protein